MEQLLIFSISLIFAFINIFIIHIIKTKFPKAYFSLGEIIINEKDDITFSGIITKFLPPLLFGIIICLLPIKNNFETVLIYSFFASFLVIWPVIISGNELLSIEARKKIKTLYLIYFFYIIIYILFALFCYFIGNIIKGINFESLSLVGNLNNIYYSWSILTQNIIASIIGSAIFALIAFFLIKIYKYLVKKLKNRINDLHIRYENK